MYTFSVAGEWAGRLLGRWYQRGVLRVGGERGLMGGDAWPTGMSFTLEEQRAKRDVGGVWVGWWDRPGARSQDFFLSARRLWSWG